MVRPSLFPTPTKADSRASGGRNETSQNSPATHAAGTTLSDIVRGDPGGKLNPQWVEWLMGWPIGWTDLQPLGTDKFQAWLRSHGGCSRSLEGPQANDGEVRSE